MKREMLTMLLMLAMVASMGMVRVWETSPFASNTSLVVVLQSPTPSNEGRDLETLTKSQPSQQIFPSLETAAGDLAGGNVYDNKTKASDQPERDSTSSEVGTDLPERESFTDLPQKQGTTEIFVQAKEPTTAAEEKFTTNIPITNGTQKANEFEAIAPSQSELSSNDDAESPETTSETQNTEVTEKAMSKPSRNLNPNSNLQVEKPAGTETKTAEEVVDREYDTEKHTSEDQTITIVNNQPKLRRKSSRATPFPGQTQLLEESPDDSIRENLGSGEKGVKAGFKADVEKEVKVCDYSVGSWVLDKTRPLYSGRECTMWLSPDWACRLHNHPDKQMDRYRWQPAGCNLPVFNASATLETLRNKVLVFVGDSLGRQQWQSLLCMLTHGKSDTAISDAASMFHFYTPRGSRRPTGWAYRFDATNTTIVFKWSVTLARVESLNRSTNALHLDQPEQFLADHLHHLDIVILNSGHHWNTGKIQQNMYNFYSRDKPMTRTSVPTAYNQTIHNIVNWVHDKTRNSGKAIYYRTLSPRHFRNGDWNSGGTCDNTSFEEKKRAPPKRSGDANAESAVAGTNVRLLNITALSLERGETHVAKYGREKGGQDCLHWCLPGVPDTWNEILLADLAARAASAAR